MKNKKLTNRVAYDQIEIGWMSLAASVSKDGEKIYFGESGIYDKPPHYYKYEYIIKEDKINAIEPILFEELDEFEVNFFEPGPNYNNDYDKYFDLTYHIGHSMVNMGEYFIYIRLPSGDALFKDLQIVTCKYSNGKEKVYNIFKQ